MGHSENLIFLGLLLGFMIPSTFAGANECWTPSSSTGWILCAVGDPAHNRVLIVQVFPNQSMAIQQVIKSPLANPSSQFGHDVSVDITLVVGAPGANAYVVYFNFTLLPIEEQTALPMIFTGSPGMGSIVQTVYYYWSSLSPQTGEVQQVFYTPGDPDRVSVFSFDFAGAYGLDEEGYLMVGSPKNNRVGFYNGETPNILVQSIEGPEDSGSQFGTSVRNTYPPSVCNYSTPFAIIGAPGYNSGEGG